MFRIVKDFFTGSPGFSAALGAAGFGAAGAALDILWVQIVGAVFAGIAAIYSKDKPEALKRTPTAD